MDKNVKKIKGDDLVDLINGIVIEAVAAIFD